MLLILWFLSAFLYAAPLVAQAESDESQYVTVRLHDVELTDQDSRKVLFETDVIGEKVVVIIPFYTTCVTNYPILVFTLKSLQNMLGDRLGKEVGLVAISVDPRTDIPVRLKAFARRNQAREGWTFLTGERHNLGQVLWGVGVIFSANIDEHNHIPITVIGSRDGRWKRLHGFPSPDKLMEEINLFLQQKAAS